MNKLIAYKQRLFDFFAQNAHTKKAEWWLAIVAFTESSFFIVPPDVLLVGILMYGANRWIYYASLTTIFSVLGGILGYLIGFLFFDIFGDIIINTYNLQDEFLKVSNLYQNNAFWAIFVASFTPIPYKIFTITAGLFKISFPVFVMASIVGRGIRFFLVAFIMKLFGKRVLDLFTKYFNIFTICLVVVVILILIF